MTSVTAPTWADLVGLALRARHDAALAGQAAALRLGAHPATEVSAYAHTEPYLTALPRAQRVGARRAAAICAKHPGAAQPPRESAFMPLGRSFARLHQAVHHGPPGADATAISRQVDALAMLDVEAAAQAIDLLVGRCAAAHVAVNFFDLTSALVRWGNGITSASREARARIVTDFYSA